jgi:xylono-1,5-lactonase
MEKMSCLWDAKATLGEGPIWLPQEQILYWVDIKKSLLHQLQPESNKKETWSLPGAISSVVPCADGGLIGTFQNGVFKLNLDNNEHLLIVDPEPDRSTNRANDGCCDPHGNFWFGTMDNEEENSTGAFYCLDTQGHCQRVLDEIIITNGPTFSADGEAVFFTHTLERKIYKAQLSADGTIGELQLFITIDPDHGYPDGMCTDLDNHLWVAHFAGARITRFTPQGEIERVIPLPVPNITKCVFGGKDMNTLFITTASKGMSDSELEQYPLAGGLFCLETPFTGFNFPAYGGPTTQRQL